MLGPPPDPRKGEDVLAWARALGRWARQVTPREGPDIYPQVNGSGTSYLLRRRGSGLPLPWFPFQFYACPPPTGETDDDGPWGYVCKNSWLTGYAMNGNLSNKPTDKITIPGLGVAGAFQLKTSTAPWHLWLKVDLTPLNPPTGAPTQPTASIANGLTWDPSGLSLFATRFYYNTDDGTPGGSDSSYPPQNYQTTVIIPIGYIVDPTSDDFDTATQFGVQLTPTMFFVQQLFSNIILLPGCYSASNAVDGWPALLAPQPTDPT
jgi:hypothetical protein